MNTHTTRVLAAAAGAIAFGAACPPAHAQKTDDVQPIVFLTGFEPPAYLTGPLMGQDNWDGRPDYAAAVIARVEKGLGPDGSQAVRIDPSLAERADCEWWRPMLYQMRPDFPILKVEWDAFYTPSKLASDAWETLVYDAKGSLLTGMVITPGGVTYLAQGPEPPSIPTWLPLQIWNHFEMRLNFSAGTADFFLNGVPLTPAPIPQPALSADTWIGSVAIAVLNPGLDRLDLDNLSMMSQRFICRPNCDESIEPPVLNVLDFMCFQKAFVEALSLPPKLQVTSYANFDGSLVDPVLNVNDYMAFLNAFAAGCR